MVDLREKTKENRGLLKKIELCVPGFRGYRNREDLRIGDSLLRTQLANEIKNVILDAEQCRKMISKKMELDFLEDTGNLITRLITLEGKILHAQQGYTGISPDYRIEEEALNKLYEWDLELFNDVGTLKKSINFFKNVINSGNTDGMKKEISNIERQINDFKELLSRRQEKIAGLGVK